MEDVDKDTNDRTLEVDELEDIMYMLVVVNDNNTMLVFEMI